VRKKLSKNRRKERKWMSKKEGKGKEMGRCKLKEHLK
jgi:hypothetical protein